MKYANETLALWYMSLCTFIVITNPESHIPFIGAHVVAVGLYKWLTEREYKHAKTNPEVRSDTV